MNGALGAFMLAIGIMSLAVMQNLEHPPKYYFHKAIELIGGQRYVALLLIPIAVLLGSIA